MIETGPERAGRAKGRPLTAHELLRIWERAVLLHPVDSALHILAMAGPPLGADALALMPVGQRDSELLDIRRATIGDRLEARDQCPACGFEVELILSCAELTSSSRPVPLSWRMQAGGHDLIVRPLNSLDLAAAASATDEEVGRRVLLGRAIVAASLPDRHLPDDVAPTPDQLPAPVESAVVASLSEHDPLAEVLLEVQCPACAMTWSNVLDVPSFVTAELAARGRRLLADVDTLARAYGWSESEILGLTDDRRAAYVALATT